VLKGGLGAWIDAGLPTERGTPPGPLDGRALYNRHCVTCHQADGKGLSDRYPTLVGDALVSAPDSTGLTFSVLDGLGAPNQPRMPAYRDKLTAAEEALLESWIRAQWGPAGAVTAEAVGRARAEQAPSSQDAYARRCAACHGGDGRGIAGKAPTLVGNGLVTMADDVPLTRVLLEGQGPFSGPRMPAFYDAVSAQELAQIETYIRSQWGHSAAPVSPSAVEAVREQLKRGN